MNEDSAERLSMRNSQPTLNKKGTMVVEEGEGQDESKEIPPEKNDEVVQKCEDSSRVHQSDRHSMTTPYGESVAAQIEHIRLTPCASKKTQHLP